MKDDIWYLAGMEGGKGFLKDDYQLDGGNDDGVELGPLNRINIFVGENNSGKSRLIRRIAQGGTHLQEMAHGKTPYGVVKRILDLTDDLEPSIGIVLTLEMTNNNDDGIFMAINAQRNKIKDFENTWHKTNFWPIDYESIIDKIRRLLSVENINYLVDPTPTIDPRMLQKNESRDSTLMLFAEKLGFLTILDQSTIVEYYERINQLRNDRIPQPNLGQFDVEKVQELIDSIQLFRQTKSKHLGMLSKKYIPILRSTHRLINEGNTIASPLIFEKTTRTNYKEEYAYWELCQ
jgi:hypothetical protein